MNTRIVCFWLALCLLLGLNVHAASINEVDYFSLSGNAKIDFESLAGGPAPGTNYDAIINLVGASFGERFLGQTLSYSGDSDIIGGSPSGNLVLVAGDPGQNLNIHTYSPTEGNVLSGVGWKGFPDFDAIGEGAVAILFDKDQSEFGFESMGGNAGSAVFAFFKRDGSLISTLTPTNLGTDWFGFVREGNIQDIAGISIYNTDPAGIGFDNIIFDVPGSTVPIPGAVLLSAAGAGLVGWLRRRRTL